MLSISPRLSIPEQELVERFIRASGPGGQNVNKVSTAVELRFDAANSSALPDPVRARLLVQADRRIGSDGVIVICAQRFRSQERNRQDARERLAALIRSVLTSPPPRIATRPTRASQQRRIEAKKGRARIKQGRGKRWGADT